eukprot:TRINITY_DN37120_c0_g1_i1.p1 TRINITY_DN37120_c0_g1~~TRINITY_DN37120_c0_g1_i1.p1  ORF type:complete len:329 (+),score=55.47 TRINITY_DN37120_c0_g1_i1:155-1141(+)
MSRYKPFNDVDIGDDFVMPPGNSVRGQLLFKKHCSQCHTIRRDGLNPYGSLMGPSLYGVMGRTAGQNQRTSWAKYSTSVEDSGILWTERNMMAFLRNPRAFAGGAINMNFRGIESFKDRVDIVEYLKRAGHDQWMLQDGTPHSQRGWWNRGAGSGQSYWDVHAEGKQLKPWQHVTRAVSAKIGEMSQTVSECLGVASTSDIPVGATTSGSSARAAAMQNDPDARTWRQVSHIEDGVHSASLQQSFNWPPREAIDAGPIRRPPPKSGSSGGAAKERGKSTRTVVSAQENTAHPSKAAPDPPPGGAFAPSGLVVFPDRGGPAYRAAARAA